MRIPVPKGPKRLRLKIALEVNDPDPIEMQGDKCKGAGTMRGFGPKSGPVFSPHGPSKYCFSEISGARGNCPTNGLGVRARGNPNVGPCALRMLPQRPPLPLPYNYPISTKGDSMFFSLMTEVPPSVCKAFTWQVKGHGML